MWAYAEAASRQLHTQNGNPMPAYRYPRPPIEVAALFRSPSEEEPIPIPAWWPGDKQLELTFLAPSPTDPEVWS